MTIVKVNNKNFFILLFFIYINDFSKKNGKNSVFSLHSSKKNQRWRVSRNGAPQAGRKKGEIGGGVGRAVAGFFSLAAHLPCSLRRAPPFRCERSEQAEPPACSDEPHHSTKFCGQIFAEPPTTPYRAPAQKKRSPRISGNRVVRRAMCDLRCTMHDFANRKS